MVHKKWDEKCTRQKSRFKIQFHIIKQESPPVWTQEAYRLSRRKCSLCWSVWGEGYPISGLGGYPIQGLGGRGYLISGQGIPHPRVGYPIPWPEGTPHRDLAGVPPTWDGVPPFLRPEMGYPPPWDGVTPGPGMGYPPPSRPGQGTPPDLARVPPHLKPEMRYPPTPEMGYPSPPHTWDGVPLPRPEIGYPPPQTWDGVTPTLDLKWGTPLWTDTQTRVKTLPSRRTTYVGGNELRKVWKYCKTAKRIISFEN